MLRLVVVEAQVGVLLAGLLLSNALGHAALAHDHVENDAGGQEDAFLGVSLGRASPGGRQAYTAKMETGTAVLSTSLTGFSHAELLGSVSQSTMAMVVLDDYCWVGRRRAGGEQ